MEIQYYIKHVYGDAKMYLLDEKFQKVLNRFNGHKTVTPLDKLAFEALGYTFVQTLPPLNQ